jgi:hypothetical protein
VPESLRTFAAIVTAIFVEAMPFLALGALLSAAIEVFVPPERLVRYMPRGLGAGVALGVAAGLFLPTCECGVVPIVRRLIHKGVPTHVAVAFMLSAPIVNPVVLASTWFAFQGNLTMVGGRMLMAACIASVVALVGRSMGNVLTLENSELAESHGHGHEDHGHGSENGRYPQQSGPVGIAPRIAEVLRHGGHEFIDMGRFLILGAIAAGLFKTFLPQGVFLAFTGNPTLQIVGMMILAVLLSICSEADAFVAASFRPFSAASQLAFVTIGPMVDLKLIGMYAATFTRPFFWMLMIIPTVLVLVFSMLFGVIT